MRILIDGRPVRNPMSGSAAFVVHLARALNNAGVDITAYLQSNKGRNAELAALDGVKSVTTLGSRLIENVLAEISILPGQLRHYREAIIHETYFAPLPLGGARKMATVHDVIPLEFPEWFTWRNSYFAKRNFLRQTRECTHIVFSSEYTRQRALVFSPREIRSSVVHLAASDAICNSSETYQNPVTSSAIPSDGGGFVLMVGNIEPRKNIPLVANAISILNKRLGLDLDLVIAGKANYKEADILAQAMRLLGKNPVCLGFVDERRKIELYQQCACHVYASKYEGFGLPVVEGLIIGCPSVIAQNSSLTEITPDPFFGFNADDPEDLADAIERNMYRSPHKSARVNPRALREYFSWARVAQDYISIYKGLN